MSTTRENPTLPATVTRAGSGSTLASPSSARRWTRVPTRWQAPAVVVASVLLAGVLHVLWWRFMAGSGGDIAAQDAWAEFARKHPGSAYNLGWYGGMHPISYSVLSPYVMAALGVRLTMVVTGTVSAGLLAWLVVGRPGQAHRWQPALYGAVALVGNAVSGRVTFALGTMFGLAALCVVFAWPWPAAGRRWRWVRGVLAGLCSGLATAMSPVAGLFLGVIAAACWLQRRRAASLAIGVPPVVVVAVSTLLFPFEGWQPMSWNSTILPIATGIGVVLLVPAGWHVVRMAGALYVVAVVLAWAVPSPIGSNITRLGLLFGGVALVAAATVGIRSSLAARRLGDRAAQVLLILALATATTWQVSTAAKDSANSALPEAVTRDIDPLLGQLAARGADRARVEVVPTHNHSESTLIAPHVPLARGWNRQADARRNPIFYGERPLTRQAYRRWLHRWGVAYVVLSTGKPDPAAEAEAELVAGGVPYLRQVWADTAWTLYEVRNPTPLVSEPGRVQAYDAAQLTITTPRAARIVIRIADSPWLSLVDGTGETLPAESGACLTHLSAEQPEAAPPPPDDWLVLHAPAAGTYRIAAPYKLPRGTACP